MSHEHESNALNALEHQIAPLLKGLRKAIEEKDNRMSLDILEQLEAIKVNRAILEKTKIGAVVNKLNKSDDKKLAEKAKHLVDKWKDLVHKEGEKAKNKANTTAKKIEPPPIAKSESPAKEASPTTPRSTISKQSSLTSSASDLRSSNGTENEFRKNMIKRFTDALGSKANDDDMEPIDAGTEIEDELFALCGGVTTEYKEKLRSLLFNLKDPKNPYLRANVLTGKISATELVRAKPEDLASPELKEWRQKEEKKLIDSKLSEPPASARSTTDMFRCGKCGQRKCVYHQLQTRSADEPMTTFITCMHCGNKWKQY
eukprot:TRINITY_DN7691_c0_g1_i1.p1 TRINITY_DN7691_c0_g1~~TRINITY_DN7691_c0_g1_i1.p1  ORF type:complete len:315 (+),score=89.57 TRINITY_DN7691_c0_g1_i1:142-1086(+)